MCAEWNMKLIEARMARKVCDRLWEEFGEVFGEAQNDWGEDRRTALQILDELEERLLKVLPYGPKED